MTEVLGNKTIGQCRNFFFNYRHRYNLLEVLAEYEKENNIPRHESRVHEDENVEQIVENNRPSSSGDRGSLRSFLLYINIAFIFVFIFVVFLYYTLYFVFVLAELSFLLCFQEVFTYIFVVFLLLTCNNTRFISMTLLVTLEISRMLTILPELNHSIQPAFT